MINIAVEKKSTENTITLLRRFSKRVRGSGILNRMRSTRYFSRHPSQFTKKKAALKRIAKRESYEELLKQGKVVEPIGREKRRSNRRQ